MPGVAVRTKKKYIQRNKKIEENERKLYSDNKNEEIKLQSNFHTASSFRIRMRIAFFMEKYVCRIWPPNRWIYARVCNEWGRLVANYFVAFLWPEKSEHLMKFEICIDSSSWGSVFIYFYSSDYESLRQYSPRVTFYAWSRVRQKSVISRSLEV